MAQFVIVHGAWHGGWAWRGVRAALEAAGHHVLTPTLPGLGTEDSPKGVRLQDCVDALVDRVDEADVTDVVLVGHSWGGIVAGGALPRLAGRVRHLVMFSAFVPAVGQSLFDLVPPEHGARFEVAADDDGPYAISPRVEHFGPDYVNDATAEVGALVYALGQPQPFRTFSDPLTREMDFHAVPVAKTYLLAEDDHALPEGEFYWTPRFADALGGDLIRVPGAHELPFTNPDVLARALEEVAERSARAGEPVTCFVLVHGGWHGGWAWRPVRARLESLGHRVVTPTLAGFREGDRRSTTTLRDCVESLVVDVAEADLTDVVLVGHSWGGIVAGAAAARLGDRVRHLCFYSAYLPRVGESQLDLMPPERVARYAEIADASPDRCTLPAAEAFHNRFMNDTSRAVSDVVHRLLQPQPWRTWSDPLEPGMDFHDLAIPRTYLVPRADIACGAGEQGWVARFGALSKGVVVDVPGAHEALFTRPGPLAEAIAAAPSPTVRPGEP